METLRNLLAALCCSGGGTDKAAKPLPSLSKKIRATVDGTIQSNDEALRALSLEIHSNPELGFQEFHAVSVLTAFLKLRGFTIVEHAFGIETAFLATYEYSEASPTAAKDDEPVKIGFCSEYDALPDLGHACGHNLIAIAGVAAALATKEAIIKHNIYARVTLFGTPAEEGGGGKVRMLEAGAFADQDICMMVHPGDSENSMPASLAMQWMEVNYVGKAAHAAASPWDGTNALDGVCLAFSNVSHMRQQILPSDRVHGIVTNGGAKPNIIPDHAGAKFIARSRNEPELTTLVEKTVACFSAAAQASGTQLDVMYTMAYTNLVSNPVLTKLYQQEMTVRGVTFPSDEEMLAESMGSTDFGNVSHAVPGLQPQFYVGVPGVDVHTRPFVEVAKSPVAHASTLRAAASIASAALTVATHKKLLKPIRKAFLDQRDKTMREREAKGLAERVHRARVEACAASSETAPLLSADAPPPSYSSVAPTL
ncbi:hypothetical protein H9P43_003445 [Blastocladiella emersonii ATCC 22665]|nr:hypothetical protein H9P43_003445 [Blastocladiella emersonii ATCC 22665]